MVDMLQFLLVVDFAVAAAEDLRRNKLRLVACCMLSVTAGMAVESLARKS